MTIEIAPKAPSSASAKTPEGASDKKSSQGAAGKPAGPSSFMAALACAEDGAASSTSNASVAAALAADEPVPSDSAALAEALQVQADASQVNPALLLGQVPVVPPTDMPLAGASSAQGKPMPGAGKDGLQALQGALDSGVGKPPLAQAKSGKAALDAAAQAATPALADGTTSAQGSATAAKEVLPDRLHKMMQDMNPPLVKAPDISTVALGGSRERPQELQWTQRTAGQDGVAQTWAATPQGTGGAMGVDGVVAGAASAATDGQYSEQVSYWIGQDVQKAEMTLDGLGANPVEVSISMQGKEATVVFRTDEAVTREALSNASADLQEAMERQGVVLSGVSVGTSNSGDSPREGSGGKQSGWRRAAVEVAPEAAIAGAVRPAHSGRSIDLFV